jgi:hypothetical protein
MGCGRAVMYLQEEASVPPCMNDVVAALGFLAEVPAGCEEKPSNVPQKKQVEGEQGIAEAVAAETEAHIQGKTTQTQCIIAPAETKRM